MIQIPLHKTTWYGQTLNWGISWHIIECRDKKPVTSIQRSYMTLRYSIVNIHIFRLGGIRSHMIENISVMSTLTLSPGPRKSNLLKILSYPQMCEDILKSIDKCRCQSDDKVFFSKHSHSYLDLEPSNLKVELAQDIIIPNNCVKIY